MTGPPVTTAAPYATVTAAGAPLADVDDAAIEDGLARHGAVLLRGFAVDHLGFEAFTRRFADHFVTNGDPGRVAQDGDSRTTTVTPGRVLLPPHSELAFSPFRPDLLWFRCVRPSRDRGELLLCDGIDLWDRLPAELRDAFGAGPITYRIRAVSAEWVSLFTTGPVPDLPAAVRHVLQFPGVTARVVKGALDIDHVCPAARPTRYGGGPAFATSAIIQPDLVELSDGSALDPRRRLALVDAALALSHPVAMQADDIVVVDNTRVLHGRMPFADARRKVTVRMGYARTP
jgi:alpha-ketoglutarate-dependent taurine dioxygenase